LKKAQSSSLSHGSMLYLPLIQIVHTKYQLRDISAESRKDYALIGLWYGQV